MRYRASRSPLSYLGGLLALYLAVPVVAFLIRLAQPGDRGFGTPGLWSALWTSVAGATMSTGIVAVLGIPLAYWLARSSGPLTRAVWLIAQLPLALPPVMSGLVLIYLVGPYTWLGNLFNDELTGTIVGVVLAQTFVAGPFLIIAARTAFAGVDPALEDLAAALGHGPASRFFGVSLRIAAPGIRAGLLMTWLRAIGEYGATVMLAYHPYTLPVFVYVQFSSTGIPGTQAPTALAIGVAVTVLLASQVRLARRRRAPRLPAPAAPPPVDPVTVSFDLDVTVGTFRLRVAHQAASNRIAILGPSGAGKSITLRAVAGFLGAGAGSVRFNGEEVAPIRVEDRRVGYVPQGLALFPGRTAWQQAVFAIGADPAVAAWWLRTLRLNGLEDRLPGQLSGGQRQRVALARALAFRPRLVLLDEPFAALDAPVREELRREMRRLQREDGLSTVIVTHDAEEAALLADEILVVDDGRLLQAGPRAEVFARPASPQVARLLGIPNLIPATVAEPGLLAVGALDGGPTGPGIIGSIDGGGLLIAAETGGLAVGEDVLWTIRPDHITVLPAQAEDPATYPADVDDVADIGTLTTVTVRLRAGQDQAPELRVRTTAAMPFAPGDPCRVRLPAAAITAWSAPER